MQKIIVVSGLGKMYRRYSSQWHLLLETVGGRSRYHPHWALRDINFEVDAGEALGVIGDNGAGKSTLLKLLCETILPTEGELSVKGTSTALLDLGAGFHPEFTGRENIYFSGAMMGLSRKAIANREREIIEFSELEDFIDEPVKTFSSGMAVRLGFAVATGFDPELLIIDEVLAVGDQGFQKKCTDRIMQYREEGRTIIFCSHNLYQVRKLCDRVIWLDHGKAMTLGDAAEVTDSYSDRIRSGQRKSPVQRSGLAGIDPVKGSICTIEKHRLTDLEGNRHNQFKSGETLCLQIWASFGERFEGRPGIGISIARNDGTMIYTTSSGFDGFVLQDLGDGRFFCRFVLPDLHLLSGQYSFTVMATDQFNMQVYDMAEEVEEFIVRHGDPDFGLVRLPHRWEQQH